MKEELAGLNNVGSKDNENYADKGTISQGSQSILY